MPGCDTRASRKSNWEVPVAATIRARPLASMAWRMTRAGVIGGGKAQRATVTADADVHAAGD